MRRLFFIMLALVVCSISLHAQTRTYHGTVLDAANNEPLIGATVLPLGGGQGAAADMDGKFSVTVPNNVTQAKISYVGYKEQVVNLTNNMVIYLHSASTSLDDVVVVAYGTANKESLTGSVAVVGSKEIEDRPVTSVTTALEGNAPGVQVNNSTSQPGEDPTIRIRGFSSINGNNAPLYVVDGSVYSGDIAALNPADIESMSVLKDAASCALYGNRGANGVILITTKKAKNLNKVDLTLTVRQGSYGRALPFYDRMNVKNWMETSLKAWSNGRVTSGTNADYADALKYTVPNFVNEFAGVNIFNKPDAEVFDANGNMVASVLPGYTDLDWWDAVSRTGYRQEYTLSMSAATEKMNMFASAGYLNEKGYMVNNDFERYNARLSTNITPVKYLKAGLNLFAQQSESSVSPVDKDELGYTNNPFTPAITKGPIYPYYNHNADGSIIYEDGKPTWNVEKYNSSDNVAWTMREDKNNYSNTVIDGSIYGTVVLPYGFDATVKGTMFRKKNNMTRYNNWLVGSQQDVGSLTEIFYDYRSHTFMQQINWAQDYGMHHVDVLLDHENYEYKYGYTYNRKSGQELAGYLNMSNFSEFKDLTEYRIQLNTESYLGRVRYNYNQKYFAEASIRRDGSSRFAKDDRWGTFWSVGGSWVLSKEKFMEPLKWVDFLKLRAAYGSVGNDASAGYYAYWGLYEFGWPLGEVSILQPYQLAPNHLKWESTKTLDVALEGSLFNDRFNFSVGYYNKRNTDLLFWVSSPMSSGTMENMGLNPSILQNIGTMQNIGWELQFGVDIIRTKDLKWNFNLDASFLKNKIVKLPNNQDIPGQWLFQGKSLYEMYTYEWAGVDMATGNSLYAMNPESPDFYYYDDANNYVFDEDYYNSMVADAQAAGAYVEIDGKAYTNRTQYAGRKVLGTSLPTVYGSFGTNLSWKGINLGLLFTYSLGGKSWDSNYQSLMAVSMPGTSGYAIHNDVLKSWTSADATADHVINKDMVPVANTTLSSYNNAGSSRWLTSNNYLVFKNLNISYDLPVKWVSALKMQNINLGVSIDNVFIATKRKGFNPQYSFNGGQGAYYVPSRVFSFQLNVKF